MSDLSQYFGTDLTLSATGDLLLADGVEESKQRVIRRLMTNPLGYLWQPDYGAGLPSYVGAVLNTPELTALIQSQMYLEQSVQPTPQVTLQTIPNGVFAQVDYTVADTPATLAFDVSA